MQRLRIIPLGHSMRLSLSPMSPTDQLQLSEYLEAGQGQWCFAGGAPKADICQPPISLQHHDVHLSTEPFSECVGPGQGPPATSWLAISLQENTSLRICLVFAADMHNAATAVQTLVWLCCSSQPEPGEMVPSSKVSQL